MRVSLAWLKTLVDIEIDGAALAETLTGGGIEVGGVEALDRGLEDVLIGGIEELVKHPDAERLWLCRVDIGTERLTIVTGAQNLRVGDRVPVAVIGAKLPNGVKIKLSKLRGVASAGMLCSTEELLLDASLGGERSKEGIWILEPEAPVGEKLAAWLGLEDTVLELELYPNRPDCLAMIHVAREVASLTGAALHLPSWADEENYHLLQSDGEAGKESLSAIPGACWSQDCPIVIDDPDVCWRYAGLLVEDVRIGPSPRWLQQRLRAAGVRAINNIVDITNYCMLEMGQPLHAFDRDKISGAVHVRRARSGEELITLDHTKRLLDEDMLLIADEVGPIALAGVMGGLESEVTATTRRLLVEAAHFAGVSIRRTSRRLGLASEASLRFEKGVNPYGMIAILGRVAELLIELKAGTPVGLADTVSQLPPLQQIRLTTKKTGALLGVEIRSAEIEKVLQRLRFVYQPEEEQCFAVNIPTYRSDLRMEEDLIEEVARIIGYERIPTTLPEGLQTQGRRTFSQETLRQLRRLLISQGLNEVLTYSFARPEQDGQWGNAENAIALLNPLREEMRVMRTTLLPGLLEIASRNRARRNMDLSIFEIGNVYHATERPLRNLPAEITRLAGVAIGKRKKHWLSSDAPFDFYYIKGLMEEIAWKFRLSFSYRTPENPGLLHPGRSAAIWLAGAQIGTMGEIHPSQEKQWGVERAVLFELDLEPLIQKSGGDIQVAPIPRFPAGLRDLSVVVDQEIPASAVAASIRRLGGELLRQVELFDVYTGKSVPEGQKSLAFSLRYQSLEETLTDEKINEANERILEGIQQEFDAERRK
jgi:phenylalanyl-tRNA synthetase beta chain